MPGVRDSWAKLATFSSEVRSGNWKGHSGKRITDVVNIGIGGSDEGPRMVINALKPFVTNDMNFHFVANVDGADLHEVLKKRCRNQFRVHHRFQDFYHTRNHAKREQR